MNGGTMKRITVTGFFSFTINPLDQIFDQIDKGCSLESLNFDFEISGLYDEGIYFCIQDVVFKNFEDLESGVAEITLEYDLEKPWKHRINVTLLDFISDFLVVNNFFIRLFMADGKTVSVIFRDLKLRIQ